MSYPDEDFFFTAQSLSAFESCPLKFRYRYIEGVRWDEGDKAGRGFEAGREFHLAARRYFSGIDTEIYRKREDGPDIQSWIENLKTFFPLEKNSVYRPELKIRFVEGKLKLEANIDLLIIRGKNAVIWDWKTHSPGSTAKNDYAKSLQTMVYLFVAYRQIPGIIGLKPEETDVSMLYWQPEPPGILSEIIPEPETVEKYGCVLAEKIKNIETYDWKSFKKVQYQKSCRNCEFNRLCSGCTAVF